VISCFPFSFSIYSELNASLEDIFGGHEFISEKLSEQVRLLSALSSISRDKSF